LRRPLALALALVACCGCGGGPSGGTDRIEYVALGDSVAAGFGLGDDGGPCGRSQSGYPTEVAAALGRQHAQVSFTLLACSGATAAGRDGLRTLHGQVDEALATLTGAPALVTVTIGINDLEWWNPARVAVLLGSDDAAFERWLTTSTDAISTAVGREVGRLLERPRLAVVLTGYYDPLNPGSPLLRNDLLCPRSGLCRERVRRVVSALDDALAGVAGLPASASRVAVARVADAFRGHEAARPACGDAPPAADRTWIQQDCFHPNRRGAAAIAASVDRAAMTLDG
jgi:lysophospholipase L1-like esterase